MQAPSDAKAPYSSVGELASPHVISSANLDTAIMRTTFSKRGEAGSALMEPTLLPESARGTVPSQLPAQAVPSQIRSCSLYLAHEHAAGWCQKRHKKQLKQRQEHGIGQQHAK